jgi:hypothetical protein
MSLCKVCQFGFTSLNGQFANDVKLLSQKTINLVADKAVLKPLKEERD